MTRPSPLTAADRIVLALLAFFVAVGLTLELYWVLYNHELVARADHELPARLFKIYGEADRGYYDRISPTAVGLEQINVFVTQLVNLWLIGAVARRAWYRHLLQLVVGTYLSYSVVLYFWSAHACGYPDMRAPSAYAYFLFYAPNLPWLLGYGFLAVQSARALARRLRAGDPA